MSEIKVRVLRCGSITVSRDAVGGKSFYLPASRAMTPLRERVELPVCCFLIEHPRGLVLLDTGLSRDISPKGVYSAGDAATVMSLPLSSFYRPCLPAGQAIHEQLDALGLRPGDLDLVLLSHLDADHVCGLRHLEGARHVMCAQEDYWWSCRTVYKLRQPKRLWLSRELETFWYKGSAIGPTLWTHDLYGDGSFMLIHLPGHTEGQFGLLLENGGRRLLLTADAAFRRENWQELVAPGYGFNPEAQLKSLKWIREKSLEPSCLGVLASHDTELAPGLITL